MVVTFLRCAVSASLMAASVFVSTAESGIVEDQHITPSHEGAGNGNALLLAAGEGHAAFADKRLIPVVKGHNVLVDRGADGCLPDHLRVRPRGT